MQSILRLRHPSGFLALLCTQALALAPALAIAIAFAPTLALALPALPAMAADREPIRLGMVNAQTGPASALGQGMLAGAQAVFKDVNLRGGVHGRQIALQVADDGYEPEQTVEQTLRMVQDNQVLALFGYVGTPTTNAVLPLLAEMKVPLVGVFSGAASLRRPVTRQLFNVRASYEEETEALVAHLIEGGARRVAVVYQNDGFGIAVLTAVQQALRRGALPLHARAAFQRNTVAIKMALLEMLQAQPDTIVLAGPYVPVAAFIQQARALGLPSRFAPCPSSAQRACLPDWATKRCWSRRSCPSCRTGATPSRATVRTCCSATLAKR